MPNPYLEDDDFRHFLRLARRGGKPAASGGEGRSHALAKAMLDYGVGLDQSAREGAKQFLECVNWSMHDAVDLIDPDTELVLDSPGDAGPRGIDLFSQPRQRHPEETGWVADPDDGCPIPNAEPPWAKKDDAPDPDVAWYVTKARDIDVELQVRIVQLRSAGATLLAIIAELGTVQREFAELVDALRQLGG